MNTYSVYMMDYARREKIPIGTVVERREKDRKDNFIGLLKMARKAFSHTPQAAFQIVLDKDVLTRA